MANNANTATQAANCAVIDAVFVSHPEISKQQIEGMHLLVSHPELTDKQLDAIRRLVEDKNATTEPPMSCDDAARLLGISKTAVHYHARCGRIRRASIPGSKRALGFVAADVRAILEGRAA